MLDYDDSELQLIVELTSRLPNRLQATRGDQRTRSIKVFDGGGQLIALIAAPGWVEAAALGDLLEMLPGLGQWLRDLLNNLRTEVNEQWEDVCRRITNVAAAFDKVVGEHSEIEPMLAALSQAVEDLEGFIGELPDF